MSRRLDRQRARIVQRLSLVAAGAWILFILFSMFSPSASDSSPRTGHPVLKNFSAIKGEIARIRVTTSDGAYNLLRQADQWVLAETGGYPVRSDRVTTLIDGLETLSWGERRTADPARLSYLGLGDPRDGGNGVLVEVFARDGARTGEVITGRRGGQTYARAADETVAFRARGTLPPLHTREPWLDLDIIDIDASTVSAVRLTDRSGAATYLTRTPGSGPRSFRPAPPYQDDVVASALGVSTTALAITRLAPVNVKPASELAGRATSRHITETFDGLEIDLRAWRQEDGFWVTLRAIEAGEGARRARTINERADGWAFELSQFDWQEFAPDISSLVRPPAATNEMQPPRPSDFQP